jgi:hypothetical protein
MFWLGEAGRVKITNVVFSDELETIDHLFYNCKLPTFIWGVVELNFNNISNWSEVRNLAAIRVTVVILIFVEYKKCCLFYSGSVPDF